MQTSASLRRTSQIVLPPTQTATAEQSVGTENQASLEDPSSDHAASAQTQLSTVQISTSQNQTIRGIPSIVHVLHTTEKHPPTVQAVGYKHASRDQAPPALRTPEAEVGAEEETPRRMLCM